MRSKILSSKKRQTKIFTPEKTKIFWAPLWKKISEKQNHIFYISLVQKAQQPHFRYYSLFYL